MEGLLETRQIFIEFYKRYEQPINNVLKFIAAFFIFSRISSVSNSHFLLCLGINILLSIVTLFVSQTTFFILIFVACGVYISMVSVETAIITMVGILLVLIFCVRILPKESLIIPALIVGFYFKIPYFIVLFSAIYFGISAIIPICIGTFAWFIIPCINEFIKIAPRESFTPLGMLDSLMNIYLEFSNYISNNKSWFYVAFIFTAAIVITYIISKISINYSKEISALIGAGVILLGLIISNIIGYVQIGVFGMIFSIIISCILIMIVMFMDSVLDYEGIKKVQFEDDDFYYYVKLIPKRNVNIHQHKRKKTQKTNPQKAVEKRNIQHKEHVLEHNLKENE